MSESAKVDDGINMNLSEVGSPRRRRTADKSYTVRELIKELMDAEDLDANICVRFRNCDPIIVSNVDFEESQVVLEGEI